MDKDELIVLRIVELPRRSQSYLHGVRETKWNTDKNGNRTRIGIANWNNWDSSFRITIQDKGKEIYFDSGVIEELNAQIQKLKELKKLEKEFIIK